MTIAIIAAMEQELKQLREHLINPQEKTLLNQRFYRGTLEGQPVVISQCGIGKVNAALGTALLINNFQPSLVINSGSAGAIASNLNQGDVLIASAVAHHDVDVCAFGYEWGQVPGSPPRFAADASARARAEAVAEALHFPVVSGLLVSGDQFVHGGANLARIREHFPDALALEMEAAAIGQCCQALNTPWLVLRAISDRADGQASLSFEEFLPLAAARSATLLQRLLQSWS